MSEKEILKMKKSNVFLINGYYNVVLDSENFYNIGGRVYVKVFDEYITKYVSLKYLVDKAKYDKNVEDIVEFTENNRDSFKKYDSFNEFDAYHNNTSKKLIFNH